MSVHSAAKSTARASPSAPAAAQPAERREPLINELSLQHGPVDLLGRFFLKANTAARNRGLTLYFGTFAELLDANLRNQESWKPITSMYDVRYCPRGLGEDRAFCILGRNQRGDVVATQAARLFESREEDTLYDICTSSRMFYDEPDRTKDPRERCEVSASIAHTIRGRIGLNGAVWYHPTFRKRELAMIIPRMTRAFAYTRWRIDYSMGLAMEGPTKGGVIDRVGYPHREWDLRLYNAPNGDPRCCFGWMTKAELFDDLADFLVNFDAEVDVGVRNARAQQQG